MSTSVLYMSLDGFVAAPDDDLDHPLGRDGERLQDWLAKGGAGVVGPCLRQESCWSLCSGPSGIFLRRQHPSSGGPTRLGKVNVVRDLGALSWIGGWG